MINLTQVNQRKTDKENYCACDTGYGMCLTGYELCLKTPVSYARNLSSKLFKK